MIVLTGMTCSGKTSIAEKLILEYGFKQIIRYTTRPMREGEKEGVDYIFCNDEKFDRLLDNDFFMYVEEYTVANGEVWRYGTSKYDVEHAGPGSLVIVGKQCISELVKKARNPVVFYINADENEIWNRLRARGDDQSEARRRINADEEEFIDINKYIDYSVRNGKGLTPLDAASVIQMIYKKHTRMII